MNYLLLASDSFGSEWWHWLVLALGVAVIFGVVFAVINRHFRIKYGVNLIWGGVLVLIAIACIAAGIALIVLDSDVSTPICVAVIAVGVVLYALTLIYDLKKLGSAGITAIILQTVFCVGCFLALVEALKPGNITNTSIENSRIARERKNYLDRENKK